jgi:hypothetical protein
MEGIQGNAKGLTRREALKRGLVIGAVAWAVPVVQAVGIRPAYAKAPSGGCVRYCLKWEPYAEAFEAPGCAIDPNTTLPAWYGTWSALGGKPQSAAFTEDTTATTDAPGNSENSNGKPGDDTTDHGNPDKPPSQPPGNCLTCPEDDLAINELPRGMKLEQVIAVYGSPSRGFLVTFPKGWKLADLDGADAIAAKCGSEQSSGVAGTQCRMDAGNQIDAPCGDDSLSGVFINACHNGHDISHIEMILDICQ